MPASELTRLIKKNLLTSCEGAVGSMLFRHTYVRDEVGTEFDVMDNGKLSCALVVSSLLSLHGLIDRPHATVATTVKKMLENGWKEVPEVIEGCVVFWPEYNGNTHIGFYLGNDVYMSNSSTERAPVKHSRVLMNGIEPTRFYAHPSITDEK